LALSILKGELQEALVCASRHAQSLHEVGDYLMFEDETGFLEIFSNQKLDFH